MDYSTKIITQKVIFEEVWWPHDLKLKTIIKSLLEKIF